MARTATYKQAGVNIDANTEWVARIQRALHSTYDRRVCSKDGAFAGLMRLDMKQGRRGRGMRKPILVGCADGVGTKVLLGIETGRLRGLGIDLVAMNVNDLITCGATPLFFLDYLAVHKLDPNHLLQVVEGIADGCREAGCALLGGETAEMPDLYARGHIDLAGFATGVVEERQVIDGFRIKPRDVLIGLASSGLHSNGFTLVRRLIADHNLKLGRRYPELGETLADAVLRPTRIYVRSIQRVLEKFGIERAITGLAHITGGGLPENVGRILPPGCTARIDPTSWTPAPVFPFVERLGVDRAEMFRVFNMGIGFVLCVRPSVIEAAIRTLRRAGEEPTVMGTVTRGRSGVVFGRRS
jgi:phosphoribosylformylglycinamidine cyclo-ligase